MDLKSLFGTKTINLSATIYRLNAEERFPLVVLNHGTARDPKKRKRKMKMRNQSEVFVKKGFVVVVAMRRGHGDSEGKWEESIGHCSNPDYSSVAKEVVKDIRAVVDYMKKKPYVDRTKILMVGQSTGGFSSLAYASIYSNELVGVINFAGGKGSKKPYKVCGPKRLIATVGNFGKTAKIPTLWIYTEKDSFFPPPLPQKMFEAYKKKGGEGKLLMLTSEQTPYGHYLFFRGITTWEPIIDEFLREIHLLN
jgi:dienelactone hydrolase